MKFKELFLTDGISASKFSDPDKLGSYVCSGPRNYLRLCLCLVPSSELRLDFGYVRNPIRMENQTQSEMKVLCSKRLVSYRGFVRYVFVYDPFMGLEIPDLHFLWQ